MLNMDILPIYSTSSFRHFESGERHVTRVFREDVLLIVINGVLRFFEDGVPVEVSGGEFYVQKHGLKQEGIEISDTPDYFYIHFKGDFSPAKNALPMRGKVNIDMVFPILQQLEALQVSSASNVAKSAVFYRILTFLYNEVNTTQTRELTLKVIALVSKNMNKPLTLDDIAKACGYSKNHIIHAFGRETGKTPYAYILSLRIEYAKQLLENSILSVSQIAEACGFGTYINFYKAFLKSEQCSPKEWRRRIGRE